MPRVDLIVKSDIELTPRVRQICGMFDVPPNEKLSNEWHIDLDTESRKWNIGLIVGPSGSGKTQIAKSIYGNEIDRGHVWKRKSLIDDIQSKHTIAEISECFSSVGFNAIPTWLKPYAVLSNGEKFRADCARYILESQGDIVIDEFTSVVDRTVAKSASHALQRSIRKRDGRLIAISCHYDIVDWLNPDWILDTGQMKHEWRRLRRRPEIPAVIARVNRYYWGIFAKYHYMSADLNKSATCFCVFIDDKPIAFLGVLPRPVSSGKDRGKAIYGESRLVVLPDYQGLGIGRKFTNTIAAAYKRMGYRFRSYPAHPAWVRARMKDTNWKCIRKAGEFKKTTRTSKKTGIHSKTGSGMGGRFNAVFEFIGKPMKDQIVAFDLLRKK